MNFDRLYFAGAVSVVTLGVYGIARTYAETAVMLVQRVSTMMVFPKVAASGLQGAELQRSIAGTRKLALFGIVLGLACAVVVSDSIVYLIYDDRYRQVATYLPILLFGAWFTVLASFADGMLLGVGKSNSVAISNGLKLCWIVLAVPFALHHFGMKGAPFAFILGDAVRYAAQAWQKRRAGLSFLRQDIPLTLLFVGLIVALRAITGMAGLNSGISGWIETFNTLAG